MYEVTLEELLLPGAATVSTDAPFSRIKYR